jgi:hypothetical protein
MRAMQLGVLPMGLFEVVVDGRRDVANRLRVLADEEQVLRIDVTCLDERLCLPCGGWKY